MSELTFRRLQPLLARADHGTLSWYLGAGCERLYDVEPISVVRRHLGPAGPKLAP